MRNIIRVAALLLMVGSVSAITFRCSGEGSNPPPPEQDSVKPLATLWWIVAQALTETNAPAVRAAVQDWQGVGTFDGFSVGVLPPTFIELQSSITLVNDLHQQIPGRVIAGMFPSGTDGWETSFNAKFADRLAPLGVSYNAGQAMTREAWLTRLRQIQAPRWAYVLEQPVRRPSVSELITSVADFVRVAKDEGKEVVLWLSAMMLRTPQDTDLARQLWAAVGGGVDDVVWMDLPVVSQDPGQSLNSLLNLILSITPQEKVLIQWTHNPNLVTRDPDGTLAYIATCQERGVNRFVLLANPSLLRQEPWATFYRTLPRSPGTAENPT